MTIPVITTGGTIGAMPYKDLARPPRTQIMPAKGQDFVRTALQKIQNIKTKCISMEPRDSKTIDDVYLAEVQRHCETETGSGILITIGTDKIIEAAGYFHKQMITNKILKDKTIILTGAMIPLSCSTDSDGYSNLRFALTQLQQGQIGRGIYIVLCDYQDEDAKTGWRSRLYKFEPGRYQKYFDPSDARRNRLVRV